MAASEDHGIVSVRIRPGHAAAVVDVSSHGATDDVEFCKWMAREIGVAAVPGSSFFAEKENRYVRFHFAKKAETLHAAGERLLRLATAGRGRTR